LAFAFCYLRLIFLGDRLVEQRLGELRSIPTVDKAAKK
jgi:hypothetical protein